MKVSAVLIDDEPVTLSVELRRAAAASNKDGRRGHRAQADEARGKGGELG
jgi:hypothetical protein